MKMKYRPEIDGLRAVAILPVIFFHAGISFFSGGYIGVDVFFVISGFLITHIILSELNDGRFSIRQFYERRARRILPALFTMLFVCLPFAWLWMSPFQFKDFLQNLGSVIFFASNFILAGESGYFAAAAEEMPLLHTWSLAVEEQYYLFIPLILVFFWRFGIKWSFSIVSVMALGSLLLTHLMLEIDPTKNFYLLPTRAWELLVGSMCAFVVRGKPQNPNSALASIGLVLILVSVVYFDATTPFPSFYTLLPVVGSALIILYASQKELVGKILSQKPFVWIGLISYSAYLWNQPLFAFYRVRFPGEESDITLITLSIAALIISYFSWRFIEMPFRKGGLPWFQSNKVFTIIFVSLAVVLTGFGASNNVLRTKNHDWYATIIPARSDADQMAGSCFLLDKNAKSFEGSGCSFGAREGQKKVLLTGDSHAASLFPALNNWAEGNEVQLDYLTAAYCLPLVQEFPANQSQTATERCASVNKKIAKEISANAYDLVVVSAYWKEWFDEDGKNWTYPNYRHDVLMAIQALQKKGDILVVGSFPIWKPSLVPLVMRELKVGQHLRDIPNISKKGLPDDLFAFDRLSAQSFKDSGGLFYSVIGQQCSESGCRRYSRQNGEEQLNSFDYGHLSKAGAYDVLQNGLGQYLTELLYTP